MNDSSMYLKVPVGSCQSQYLQEADGVSTPAFPIVSSATRSWERTFKSLAFLVLPAAFLAGQQVFRMLVGSW